MTSFSEGLSGHSILGTVEWGSRRFELGVSFVSLLENFLCFIARQAFLSCELEGLKTRVSSACLHHFITDS